MKNEGLDKHINRLGSIQVRIGAEMGLFNSLLDAEARAVKKAVRSLDLADKHMLAKETDKAVAEADKARVALEGLDPKTVANLNDYRTAISRISNIYLDLGITTMALEVLDRFLKALPKDMAGVKLKVSALRKLNRSEEALAILDELVVSFPNDRDSHLQRKDILIKLGRPEEAMQALLKALDSDPLNEETYDLILEMTDDRPTWLGRKASALIHKDKAESALYELENALKQSPRDLTLMMIKVEALEKLGKQEEADDLLEEVLQRDHSVPASWSALVPRSRRMSRPRSPRSRTSCAPRTCCSNGGSKTQT